MRASHVFVQCVAATVLLQSLPAQELDLDLKAINSITAFKLLDWHIGQVRMKAVLTNFGPYERSGECESFGWAVDFNKGAFVPVFGAPTLIKDDLEKRIIAMIATGRGFEPAYAPVRNWLVITLPAFADRFNTASADLLSYSEKGQKVQMAALIYQLDVQIQGMEKELQGGFVGLTKFSNDMQTARESIDRELRGRMEALFRRQEKGLRDEVTTGRANAHSDVKTPSDHGRSWPACAQQAALNGFNNYRDEFRGKFNVIAAALADASGTGDKGAWMPHILTRIVEIQRRYESVRTRLKNAEAAPAGAVQELKILTAQLAVSNLAKYARGALQ